MPKENYEKAVAQFVAVLFHAGTITHFMHLQTKSYAQHKALGHFYEDIVELADKYAEAYQGCYGLVGKFTARMDNPRGKGAEAMVAYFEDQKAYVEKQRKKLPERSELQNDIDAIASLIDSTLYKLRFLS